MKIYTKTGDSGTTGLFAGPRVSKDHPRIQAYGTVDELNALLGAAVATLDCSSIARAADKESDAKNTIASEKEDHEHPAWACQLIDLLADIQSDLFAIGAQLATPDPEQHDMCLLDENRIEALERAIDNFEDQLEPLSSFILPGGCSTSAMLHVCRTVCRRAEREIVSLAKDPSVSRCDLLIIYLNRLSDLLFSAARFANVRMRVADRVWKRPGGS